MKINIIDPVKASMLTLLFMTVISPLSAQPRTTADVKEDGDIVKLDVFDVSSSSDAGYLSQNVESATRMNVAMTDIPQSILVFNEEFLADIGAETISDVAMYDPTVNTYGENDEYSMRGIGGTSSLQAGATYYNGFEQLPGIGSLSLANASRAEFLKGPNAVLYGTGAFGGVMSRTSKKPKPKAFTSVKGGYKIYDSKDIYTATLDYNNPLIKNELGFRLNMQWTEGELWNGTPKSYFLLAPAMQWQINKKITLFTEYVYTKEKRVGQYEFLVWKGKLTEFMTEFDGVRHRVNPRIYLGADEDQRAITRSNVLAELRVEFSRNLIFRSMFNGEFLAQTMEEAVVESNSLYQLNVGTSLDPFTKIIVRRYYRRATEDSDVYRLRNELVAMFPTFGAENKLIVGQGWDWKRTLATIMRTPNSADITNNPIPYPAVDLLTGDSVDWYTGALKAVDPWYNYYYDPTQASDYRIKAGMSSFYASDLLYLIPDRLILQMGGRLISSTQTRDDKVKPGTNYDISEDKFTYSSGLVYHLTKNKSWTLYLNKVFAYAPNFTLDHAASENYGIEPKRLPSMTADQFEGGFKYVYKDRFSASGCYFDIYQKNTVKTYIVDVAREDGSVQSQTWKGVIGGLSSRGVELSANCQFTEDWQVYCGYAYTYCVNKDTGDRHYRSPLHARSAVTSYKFRGPLRGLKLTLGLIWRAVSLPQEITTVNELDRPMWMVPETMESTVTASYNFKIGTVKMTAQAQVKNATDRINYKTTYNTRASLNDPRTWTFSLNTTF